MKIHGDSRSGNCLKIKYVADHLGIPYRWEEVNAVAGETRRPAFLALNPAGQVPLVEFDDGRLLAQSNAVIQYLAEGSTLLPDDPFLRAKVNEFLFWEQYSHEPYIAVCRFHMLFAGRGKQDRDAWRVERGEQALDLMEHWLRDRDWLVGTTPTIADVSLLAYTRLAGEGGFDLDGRSAVRAWIRRCEAVLSLPAVP